MATAARRTPLHHRATLNVSGSCNNLCDTAPDAAEFFARNRADNIWLQETFDEAVARGSAAVMLISQANPAGT